MPREQDHGYRAREPLERRDPRYDHRPADRDVRMERRDIYRDPNDRFVVDFVGQANFVDGTVTAYDAETRFAELRRTLLDAVSRPLSF